MELAAASDLVTDVLGDHLAGSSGSVAIGSFDDPASALAAGRRLAATASRHDISVRFALVPQHDDAVAEAVSLLGLARPGDTVMVPSLRPVTPDPGNDYFAVRATDGSGGISAYRVTQHGTRWARGAVPAGGLVALALSGPSLGRAAREELEEPPVPSPLVEPEAATAGITVSAFSPAQEEMAHRALEKFETYDLEIPDDYPLQIYFHEPADYERCGGHAALATHGADFEQIDICTSGEFALLHELGHVWANFELDDAERAELMELRGLEVWQGDPEWADNASEHVASIVAWGLGDVEVVPTMIGNADRASLEEAFTLLTGNQAPFFSSLEENAMVAPEETSDDDTDEDPLGLLGPRVPAVVPVDRAADRDEASTNTMPADAALDTLLPEDDLVGESLPAAMDAGGFVDPGLDRVAPDLFPEDDIDPMDAEDALDD